jgi:hypothetical protein
VVGGTHSPCSRQSYNAPRVQFSATVGEEPEDELGLVERLGTRALLTKWRASRRSRNFARKPQK